MQRFSVAPLSDSTWDMFAELVERDDGIFGRCWCIGYHLDCGQRGISRRGVKGARVSVPAVRTRLRRP